MTAKQQDIDDIFTMFHDFEIVRLDLQGKELTMEIVLPWAQMWNIYDYIMTFKFYGCDSLRCIYHKRITNELAGQETLPYSTEQLETADSIEIEAMGLDVQKHSFDQPEKFKLYCNSIADGIEFATLDLNAYDYKIFDNAGEEMTLDKMKEWAAEWWAGIQKMWDEKKDN